MSLGRKLDISNAVQANKRRFPIKAQILDFQGEAAIASRLLELGLREGLEISIEGRAPFSGPYIIRFGPTAIALRGEEAQCTLIKLL